MGYKLGLASCVLLLLECWIFLAVPRVNGIKIAAYNVRIFGKTKLNSKVAMDTITKIVRQYDIILIQEVRGVNADVPGELLNRVNQLGDDYEICNEKNGDGKYRFKGGTQRELYLYLYRRATVECVRTIEAEDINSNFKKDFMRPPTIAVFNYIGVYVGEIPGRFYVIGIHTKPDKAEHEINSLVEVYNAFKEKYQLGDGDPVFIMGDFNYGGTFVKEDKLDKLRIDTSHFLRLINKNSGTTVAPFDPKPGKKPYDRIYVTPKSNLHRILTVGIDRFRNGLSEKKYFETVSDHYPVYFDIGGYSDGEDPLNEEMNIDEINLAVRLECKLIFEEMAEDEDFLEQFKDDEYNLELINYCKKHYSRDEL